jgi:hypothetical protein
MRSAICLLLALGALIQPAAAYAHSQVRNPVDCVSVNLGFPNWNNAPRAETSNNQVATATVGDDQSTDALVCTQYGFAIPAAATIFGIVINVERRTNDVSAISPTRDAMVRVLKGGVAEPADRATATDYTLADVVEAHGGATDLWGATWTPAEVNNAGFGAGFVAQKAGATGGNVTVSVDHIAVEVFYSQPPPAPTLASPADGASVATPTPILAWNAALDGDGDALTYEVQVDDSGCGFASPEFSQSGIAGTSATSSPLPNLTYCWRVRATDEHGLTGPWSGTRDFTVNAGMASADTMSPGNCVSQNAGNPNWGNANRAETTNNQVATSGLNDNQPSDYLVCTQYGFAIPAGATILGIVIGVERRTNDVTAISPSRDFSLRVLKAGTAQAAERASTTDYTLTDVLEDHGGAADLWGTTWGAADVNDANFGARFQAQKAGATGGNVTISVDHMPITVYWVVPAVVTTPENFNAFETATAANAISGDIRTRVAGSGFSLDVVALSGGAQMAGFSDAVTIELLGNATLGVSLDAQNCPTTFTVLQTVAPDPTINAGRSTVVFAAVADSWRDVRVRVSYPAGSPAVSACSTDNFAIRPASFALAASDTDWENAGAARALDNTGASGGNVHKAGRPFRLTVTPSPGTTGNYDGSPTLGALACSLPAPCANGTLSLGGFGGAGARVSDSTYDEAGAFDLTLVDEDYASVDADDTPGDCSAGGRYVCQSAAAAIGRFVPDHFTIAPVVAPEFRTFGAADAACSPPGASAARSFTYIGQPFGYTLAGIPQGTVQARNAAGNPTTNYRGALWKLAADHVTQTFTDASSLTITPILGTATLSEIANTGTGTFTANSADTIAFVRSTVTPSAPFNADIRLRWSVADAAEAGAGQGTITTLPDLDFDSVAFDSGSELRYGRLRLANVNGSQLVPLALRAEAQYWGYTNPPTNTVLGFITNADDHCTSLADANLAMSGFSTNLAACETAVSGAGTLTSGRDTLLLAAPGAGNNGAVMLTANLGGAASGTTCVATGGGTVPATGAGLPYLRGNWTGSDFDDNPAARATFGAFRGSGEIIYMRENF